MVKITPIGITIIDWNTYLNTTQAVLGRNIAAALDNHRITDKNLTSFIASLAEFKQNNNSDPIKAVRNAGSLLNHVYCTFLVLSTEALFYAIMQDCDLNILITDTTRKAFALAVISGTLLQWRTMMINFSSTTISQDHLLFMNEALLTFEKLGLSDIFANYAKTPNNDGSFRLCLK